MPPKAKFKKEEIISAAVELINEQGLEGLTARELGNRLGSSARPIFTVFQSMEEVRMEVKTAALAQFRTYVQKAMEFTPAYKMLGMQVIRFAMEKPKLYQLLYMQEHDQERSFRKMMKELDLSIEYFVVLLCADYGLNRPEAEIMLENIWLHTYGISALCAVGMCRFSEDEISEIITHNFRAMMMYAKSGKMKDAVIAPEKRKEG